MENNPQQDGNLNQIQSTLKTSSDKNIETSFLATLVRPTRI